jgi:hypothetical protein
MDPQRVGAFPVVFAAGPAGEWRIDGIAAVRGSSLPAAPFLSRLEGAAPDTQGAAWELRGITSHVRYVTRHEKVALESIQPGLGRAEADRAALIPIRKSAEWWALAQDERRAIIEERSHHIEMGLRYLPAVARRLYHSRDLGGPFDFLTWFEFAERDVEAFEELVGRLRETAEWTFVEREVDIRLSRLRIEQHPREFQR